MANLSMAKQLPEYVGNLRDLLRLNGGLLRVVVERQILATLLPKLAGNRATLEPHLWALLIICLDGHETAPPVLTDEAWESAAAAAKNGLSFITKEVARFPRAALGVADAIAILRETGVLPRPLVPSP